jgi:hypothetical protein
MAYRFLLGALQGFSAGSPLGFLEDSRRVPRVYLYAHIELLSAIALEAVDGMYVESLSEISSGRGRSDKRNCEVSRMELT